MPWQKVSIMSQRIHFFNLWQSGKHSVTDLCNLFGISRKTGYKWINRGEAGGVDGLQDRTRKPHCSPRKTQSKVEHEIIALRKKHPDWGGRKLKRLLENAGYKPIPAASTITQILNRNGLLNPREREAQASLRFEHTYPNSLWQMDFKGHFALSRGRCHPLTVLDDHSRFNLVLNACATETRQVVETGLTEAFEQYGLPDRMTMDNGSPWGHKRPGHRYTKLTVWLLDLGIKVSHSRPYHPQTQGKDERFHRTLKTELLNRQYFSNLTLCQRAFDQWRTTYNFVRPHEALRLDVPADKYKVSRRRLEDWDRQYEYANDEVTRKVNQSGVISYQSEKHFLGEAFAGRWVAVRRTSRPHLYEIYYRHQCIAKMNLNK